MDISERFSAFYSTELVKDVSMPSRLSSRYDLKACLTTADNKEVYLITSRTSGEQFVLRRLSADQGDLNRAEYELLHTLNHPQIPKAAELFEEDGYSYFIRSYIPGASLYQWVKTRGLASEREAVRIIAALCDILSYLHTQKPALIHRDIKPQNVILDPDGTVFLIDFDISRKFDPEAVKDTMFMGTSATAPPEQYGYGQTDARSDIYSLGVLLIFLCTGRYERTALAQMPPRLGKIAETCTQFAPRDRYASAAGLKKALFAHKYGALLKIAVCAVAVCAIVGAFYIGRLSSGSTTDGYQAFTATDMDAPAETASRQTSVADDGTVSFASAEIEVLVRKKLEKQPDEPVALSELQSITELSIVGVSSEDVSGPIDFYSDQAYKNGEPITRGTIQTLSDLSLMKSLNNLTLIYQRIDDLSALRNLNLQNLTIIGNYVSDLSPLAQIKTLRYLNISNNPVADISALEGLDRLEALHMQQCNVADISVIENMPGLTALSLGQIPCLDLSPILKLQNLSFVEITGSSLQDAITVFSNPNIGELIAINCGIASLESLSAIPSLTSLELCNNDLVDLDGVQRYPRLKSLALRSTKINDLSPLKALTALEELDLRGVDVDLSPLLQMPSLKKIICSPDMQQRIDIIKDGAPFQIEISQLP